MYKITFLLFFIFSFISFESIVSGFCFYNDLIENNIKVVQLDNFGRDWTSKFIADIPPNGKDCCHYSNKDCNGHANSPKSLTIFLVYSKLNGKRGGLTSIYQYSGGYSVIKGNPEKLTIETFDDENQPFNYQGERAISNDNLGRFLTFVYD